MNIENQETNNTITPLYNVDMTNIKKGCNSLHELAKDLETVGKKIIEAESYCSRQSLSIEELNMEEEIQTVAELYKKVANYIDEFADSIMEMSIKTINSEPELKEI